MSLSNFELEQIYHALRKFDDPTFEIEHIINHAYISEDEIGFLFILRCLAMLKQNQSMIESRLVDLISRLPTNITYE